MDVNNLFSSWPPLEAFRVLISLMGSLQMSADSMLWNVGFFDCSRLRCFGTWYREVFAEVLEEFKQKHGRELWQSERRIGTNCKEQAASPKERLHSVQRSSACFRISLWVSGVRSW